MKVKCLRFYLLAMLFLCTAAGFAQSKRVTGRVLNDESKPLVGASIVINGKKTGTQTNSKGEFSLEASSSDLLVISATGFKSQQIRVGENLVIDLSRTASRHIGRCGGNRLWHTEKKGGYGCSCHH